MNKTIINLIFLEFALKKREERYVGWTQGCQIWIYVQHGYLIFYWSLHVIGGSLEDHIPILLSENVWDMVLSQKLKSRSNMEGNCLHEQTPNTDGSLFYACTVWKLLDFKNKILIWDPFISNLEFTVFKSLFQVF